MIPFYKFQAANNVMNKMQNYRKPRNWFFNLGFYKR